MWRPWGQLGPVADVETKTDPGLEMDGGCVQLQVNTEPLCYNADYTGQDLNYWLSTHPLLP